MFSLEQCKKYIKNADYTDEKINEIKEGLYQITELLVTEYITKKGIKNDNRETNPSQ